MTVSGSVPTERLRNTKTDYSDKFDKATAWSGYIRYLHDWVDSHNEPEFCGMMPACFDEWCGEECSGESANSVGSFKVTITETLQKTVTVDAANLDEAEQTISDNWYVGDYILNAENFVGVGFKAVLADELVA